MAVRVTGNILAPQGPGSSERGWVRECRDAHYHRPVTLRQGFRQTAFRRAWVGSEGSAGAVQYRLGVEPIRFTVMRLGRAAQ